MTSFTWHTTPLEGIFLCALPYHRDARGLFVKTFQDDIFQERGLTTHIRETAYSHSKHHVLRGMHYQAAPFWQDKIVTVIQGEVLDVVVGVDRTPERYTYGKVFSTVLSAQDNQCLYISAGYAHGFLCLSETCTVQYQMTCPHKPDYYTGVRYTSFGFDWPVKTPILSEKDRALPNLGDI